ncbi:MAG: T9SS type A sorting domain-containing protein [Calditrichaeota bacterium]|nr:T9SS type A sorting domain-containing protein [Calditrichota bacterium]
MNFLKLFLLLLLITGGLFAANKNDQRADYSDDKCGYDPELSMQMLKVLGSGWGYNYDSLLADLGRWSNSPFVRIDSAGSTVEGRILWMLTIEDTSIISSPRKRVSIHARTHPNEVQAFWVTDQIINILLSDSQFAQALRQQCVFNIIPMYNPDGVELGYGRENANGVDIESGWNKEPLQVEVQSLKNLFTSFMTSESPIKVALNMHSSVSCTRYFVYHHENGTSDLFTQYEKQFIGGVRSYWPEGFEPWDYFVSWGTSTPTQYPESWFWLNYQEQVMALTYEDMNCSSAGDYDKTASALLNGVADYLEISKIPLPIEPAEPIITPNEFAVMEVYPNPVKQHFNSKIKLTLADNMHGQLFVFDVLGRKVAEIKKGLFLKGANILSISDLNLPGGIYFTSFITESGVVSKKMISLR